MLDYLTGEAFAGEPRGERIEEMFSRRVAQKTIRGGTRDEKRDTKKPEVFGQEKKPVRI